MLDVLFLFFSDELRFGRERNTREREREREGV